MKNGLSRINVSLDTIDREKYQQLTGQDLIEKVLDNIKLAKSKGIEVKVNAVLLKGVTDLEIHKFLDFGYENDIEIRFIELMPIGDNVDYYNSKYLSSNEIINKIDCKPTDIKKNDVVTYYRYKNKYNFGVISAISSHFCSRCNRIRITSRGKLRLCLHSDNEIDLLQHMDDVDKLYKVLIDNILTKPEKHKIDEKKFAKSNMVQIGG